MKFVLLSLILTFAYILNCIAQQDSLIIKLKNSKIEKISISQIQKIQFENVSNVNEEFVDSTILSTSGNFPNPFKDHTNIEFEISSDGFVEIIIFDISGNIIQKLECGECNTGKNSIVWNCFDSQGNKVTTGTYFYEIIFNNVRQSRKMIVVK